MATIGIGAIKNIENNKIFAFKSLNLEKQWEIYQNQLNLNIHHNIFLQSDWNELGSDKFEFSIFEELYDEFFLEDEYVDYVTSLDDTYNDLKIDFFYFEYSANPALIALYDIIGRDECNPEFLDRLTNNNLTAEYYDEIKDEMSSLIGNGTIVENEINSKLTELIQEKSHNIRVYKLDMQYKLMNDLEEIVGISELKDDFKSKLKENDLPEFVGYQIKENIMELIFSDNVFDNNMEKQIDNSIEEFKQTISQEMIKKLLDKADNLENDVEFLSKIRNSNLSAENAYRILDQLKEFIKSGIVKEDNFSLKLDELINIEIENKWKKEKQELLIYLNKAINSTDLRNKLKSNNLEISSSLSKFNTSIANSIENKEITSKEEIDISIEKHIENELIIANKLKNELLNHVNVVYGSEELSKSFKSMLNEVQLSIDDGKEFISKISQNIILFKIKSIEDIEKYLDKLIFEKNRFILLNQFYNLVGKEKNNESFSKKLQFNYLTPNDGNIIRNELLDLINDDMDLSEVINLRNKLEIILDEMITNKGEINYNKLINLSNELINSLNDIIGENQVKDSFKEVLYLNNLGDEYADIIKNEILQFIEDTPGEPNYELKMDQLNNLKNKGIDVAVDEIIQREASSRDEEYKSLKSKLTSQLNELIGVKENTPYFNELLIQNNLSNFACLNIRQDFKYIILSDEIYDVDNFNYKYEELLFVENKTIKTLLLELIQKQKKIVNKLLQDIRLELLKELYQIIGATGIVHQSFGQRLYSHQLSLDYADVFRNSMKEFIYSDEIFDDDFTFKLDELVDLKRNGVDFKLNELIDEEYQIKLEELEDLKKELNSELNNLTNSIEFNDNLKSHNLNVNVGLEIKKEIYNLINSKEVIDTKFNYKLEELTNLNKKTVSGEIDELIEKHSLIYQDNLSKIRKELHNHVDSIIGKSQINEGFKQKLHDNLLAESFAGEIKTQINNFIDSDEVFNKDFEFKFDELNAVTFKDIDSMINEIIDENRALKETQLKDIRKELNNDLINLIGQSNNDYFNNLLKSNNLNSKAGMAIREELLDLINSDVINEHIYDFKLDELINLRKLGLDKKLSQIIEVKVNEYNIELNKIRNVLISDLNKICNSIAFKNKLHSYGLHYSYKDVFKTQITDFIRSDEIYDGSFEVKLDELSHLKNKSVESKVMELVKKESQIKIQELNDIRQELLANLNELIGETENNDYFSNILKSNNLNSKTGREIRNELSSLIISDNVSDNSYEFKLDELIALKELGIKSKLEEIVKVKSQEYDSNLKELRNELISDLDTICENSSLESKLYENKLHFSYKDKFKQEFSDFIKTDEVSSEKFEVKLDELKDLKEKTIEVKFDELIKKEAEIKHNEFINVRKELNDSLDDLIGHGKNNEYYANLLISKNLNQETGNKIRMEISNLINDDQIIDIDTYEFKLDELLALKHKGLKNHLEEIVNREETEYNKKLYSMRQKLLSSLKYIISKNSFKEMLYSKNINDSFINVINTNLTEFIKSDTPYDDSFEVKLDELSYIDRKGIVYNIDQLVNDEAEIRKNEFEELRAELLNELYAIIGKDKNKITFTYQLVNNNLNEEIREKIRFELIDLISSDECQDTNFKYKLAELKHLKDYGVQNKINDIIEREAEIYNNLLKEKRESLIDMANIIIGKNKINPSFYHTLKLKNLDKSFASEIRNKLIEFINSDEVYDKSFENKLEELIDLENKGIKSKIDDIIEDELHKQRLLLKENLLKRLHNITGDIPLNEDFIIKLNNASFNEEFGIKILRHFESEIDSFNIEEDYDFEKGIDEMIFDENKNILLKQTYEIIGSKADSDYFLNTLKKNMIPSKMAGDIREELLSMINESDLKSLVDLRKVTMQTKFDEIISREHTLRTDKLAELREKLLKDLSNRVSESSFKNELQYENLSIDYVDKIKNKVENFIKSDVVEGDFEFKVDELIDLNEKGVNSKIDEVVSDESHKINEKFRALKEELYQDIEKYANTSVNPAAIELNKRNLTESTGFKAYKELKDLIISKEIINSKFTSKYEELENLKKTTIRSKYIEIIERYDDNQQKLIKFLYSQTTENASFNLKLKGMNLHDDFVTNLVSDIELKIKDNIYTKESEITKSINRYVNEEAVEQDKALTKLYSIVGQKGLSLRFRAKLRLMGLSSDDGKMIVQIIDDKIKTEKLREYNVSNELEKQMRLFKTNRRGSGPQKYVFCSQCGHKNINGANFCEECGEKLYKL